MKLIDNISSPKSIAALSVYRIGLGIFMLLHLFPLFKRISNYHISEHVLYFPHIGFDWMPLFDKPVLMVLLLLSILCTVSFTIGYKMRLVGIMSSLIYLYFILVDKFYYNNHYYLLALLVFLCSLTVADRSLSIRKDRVDYNSLISGQHYFILRLMLCIVFFYGGIAKINAYWASGVISEKILEDTVFGGSGFMTALLTWGGLLFDLGIAFILMIPRTRWIAFALALVFNITNAIIFSDISWFPYFMIFSMILFFPGMAFYDKRFKPKQKQKQKLLPGLSSNKPIRAVLILFFGFQLLFPLRHYIMKGYSDWTGQGHYFSWRMKSFTKEVSLQLYYLDKQNPVGKQKLNIGFDDYRLQRAAVMPEMVLGIAANVAENLKRQGDSNFAILCDYTVNLNEQGEQIAINPKLDLLDQKYKMIGDNDWLIPWKPSVK